MIVEEIVDSVETDNENKTTITLKIDAINMWKFMRWVELMNCYDDFRKSSNNYELLFNEIITDYDKDFGEKNEV